MQHVHANVVKHTSQLKKKVIVNLLALSESATLMFKKDFQGLLIYIIDVLRWRLQELEEIRTTFRFMKT